MIKLEKNEKLIKKVRKHWFILFKQVVVLIFIFILPFVLYLFLKVSNIAEDYEQLSFIFSPALFLFVSASWSLLIWMKLASVWTDYYLDMWMITNKRVIDVEQKGFFHREISTMRMEQVQDVTIEIKGVIGTLFDFGDIHVQSAGESREFTIHGIPAPRRAKEVVLKQHELRLKA